MSNEALTKYLQFIVKKLGTKDKKLSVEESMFYYDKQLRQDLKSYNSDNLKSQIFKKN